jgi:hypothetical protein
MQKFWSIGNSHLAAGGVKLLIDSVAEAEY